MRRVAILIAIIVLAAVAAGFTAVGCGSDSETEASASAVPTGPIKVGHIANLTGAQAMVGGAQDKVLKEAFEQIGTSPGGLSRSSP